jgi:hypothetical protein
MNTQLSAPRVALIALALGAAGVTATFAQTTTPSTSTTTTATTDPTCTAGGWHHHHHGDSVLTAAERAQLKAAKEKALAANGTLQTEHASLKQQFETLKSSNATPAQWQAFHQQKKAYHKDLKAAELLVDPTLAPIFAKLEAAHQGHHHSST